MVNVIVPMYHSKDTIHDTLNALVAQTKKMFIVTLVQDCDGEDYTEIINEYRNRGLHIQLLSTKKNSGPGVARQVGIDNTKMCDYVMFCDSDDMYYPRAIELLYMEAKRHNADVVTSSITFEEKNGPGGYIISGESPVTWCGGKIYRLDYLKKNNIRFLDDLRLNEDAYFNLVACNSTDKRFLIKEHTYFWRANPNSLTRKEKDTFFERSNSQYILSQIRGLKKIYEITGKIKESLLAQTLMNIYYSMMLQMHKKVDDWSYIEELETLKENKFIQDFLDNGNNWQYFVDNLKAAVVTEDKKVYFYKVRFIDFILSYIKGEE